MATISKNLQVRAITGIALLPPVLGAVWWGGLVFQVFLAVAVLMMAREWHKVSGHAGLFPTLATTLCVVAGTAMIPVMLDGLQGQESLSLMFSLLLAVFATFAIFTALAWRSTGGIKWWIAGTCYIALAAWGLQWLRLQQDGALTVVWLLFIVWGTDVGGYFAGRALGGPKLAPTISPAKTWSGFVGGVILASALSVSISLIFDFWTPSALLGVAAFLSVISQVGDLFESALKRHFHIKDSGGLIPGHGGVLDRVDGLAFASPMCAFILICVLLLSGGMA